MNGSNIVLEQDSYINRNLAWLVPAGAVFMIVAVPLLASLLDVKIPAPSWVIMSIVIVGSLWTGYRSTQVDTISARLIRVVCGAAMIGCVISLILK